MIHKQNAIVIHCIMHALKMLWGLFWLQNPNQGIPHPSSWTLQTQGNYASGFTGFPCVGFTHPLFLLMEKSDYISSQNDFYKHYQDQLIFLSLPFHSRERDTVYEISNSSFYQWFYKNSGIIVISPSVESMIFPKGDVH